MPRTPARELRSEWFTESDEKRFWAKVDQAGDCWIWTAAKGSDGYGSFRWAGDIYRAHRFAYVLEHGHIDPDEVIDHLCRNPSCVRVSHLEAVSHRTNVQRGIPKFSKVTHCPAGHPYDETNTGWYVNPIGERERYCLTCKAEKRAAWRADPANAEKARAYQAKYRQSPDAKEKAREYARRRRAAWTPEEREAKKQYLREYHQRKKAERAAAG